MGELDEEMGQVIEKLHGVEADFEKLCDDLARLERNDSCLERQILAIRAKESVPIRA